MTPGRPVTPRATRKAAIVASVPEFTMRTISIDGTSVVSRSAICTSSAVGAPNAVPSCACRMMAAATAGCAWPRSIGPHEPMKSMSSCPSTSHTRAPAPRAMNRGAPPTARNARTGELTPPGITSRARANSAALVAVVSAWSSGAIGPSCLREEPRRLFGEVGENDVGARAPNGEQRLQHDAPLVQPAPRARRFHHRVLARYVVRGNRHAEPLFHAPDDVEVGERRLDHHDVGALAEIGRYLAQRLERVARVHLVSAAIAEARRRSRGLAKRAVEARRVLRGIRHDDHVGA